MDKGDGIFLAEEIIKLSFGLDNSFERTESLQMSFAYVSDNTIIRFGYFAKKLDFPGWLAPISMTARSCSGFNRSRVVGTPMWLLRLPKV